MQRTPFPLPVRSAVAAQSESEAFDYLPMPRQMNTFEMPRVPQAGPGHDVAGAHAVLADALALAGVDRAANLLDDGLVARLEPVRPLVDRDRLGDVAGGKVLEDLDHLDRLRLRGQVG